MYKSGRLSCQQGLSDCSGNCVNTQIDRTNCGSCGNSCESGQICSSGNCQLSCQQGLSECNNVCVNFQSDNSNCGSCGNSCGQGEICSNGSCTLQCSQGLTECSGSCIDTRYHPEHCGGCGQACSLGQYCANGSCAGIVADSCLTIINSNSSAESGIYTIYRNDREIEVYCDMDTDGGGYTFLKVNFGSSAYATDAESYCADRGMQLFIPRTQAHLVRAYRISVDGSIGPSGHEHYVRLMGIYPESNRATCSRTPLRSGNSSCRWRASDSGPFWVTDRSNISEPNGDNHTTASMYYSFNSDGSINWYNDINSPGYNSQYFTCDVGDKQ